MWSALSPGSSRKENDFFGKFFKTILKVIAIILVIIAIVYLIVAAMFAAGYLAANSAIVGFLWTTVGFIGAASAFGLMMVGLAAFALACIIDKDTATKTIGKVISGLSDLGSKVVDGAGNVIDKVVDKGGSILTNAFSSVGGIAVMALVGFGVYKYVTRERKEPTVVQIGNDVPSRV